MTGERKESAYYGKQLNNRFLSIQTEGSRKRENLSSVQWPGRGSSGHWQGTLLFSVSLRYASHGNLHRGKGTVSWHFDWRTGTVRGCCSDR